MELKINFNKSTKVYSSFKRKIIKSYYKRLKNSKCTLVIVKKSVTTIKGHFKKKRHLCQHRQIANTAR